MEGVKTWFYCSFYRMQTVVGKAGSDFGIERRRKVNYFNIKIMKYCRELMSAYKYFLLILFLI